MKKLCYLLSMCNVARSHGLDHGVFLDEDEAVAEMWQLASVFSRAHNLPIGYSDRRCVVVGDTCFRIRSMKFFG